MERLPLAVSLPHCGTRVPVEVASLSRLSSEEMVAVSHPGLADLCGALIHCVEVFATTRIASLFVDLDCPPDDRSPDGVIKSHTPSRAPVFREFPAERVVTALLERYHRPYHDQLRRRANRAMMGLDLHAMPCRGRNPGTPIDESGVSLHPGPTVPCSWTRTLAGTLERHLHTEPLIVWRDTPGYITRTAPGAIPWIRVELDLARVNGSALDSTLMPRMLSEFYRGLQRRGSA